MKHTVCAVTGSRAEFGLLRPLLEKIDADEQLELKLVVTGSHLENSFGKTVSEIEESGISGRTEIAIPLKGDKKSDMAKAVAAAIEKITDYFSENRPELLVILGDRYEIFAAAASAAILNIPIAHIHGGETTQGAVDEFLRHSITKMSTLHFTACEEYRKRVIQLGESPERVFNVGGLGAENFLDITPVSADEFRKSVGLDIENERFSLVTFHPVTMEEATGETQVYELIRAMDSFTEMNYIITMSNADAGGRLINRIWESESSRHKNWRVVSSLGSQRYMTALRYAEMVIGNSSSGILEAPSAHIPTVNIGDRQRGRIQAESIINCKPEKDDIERAIALACSDEFKEKARNAVSPYGDGKTSERILGILKERLSSGVSDIKKEFYDIPFNI